MTCEILVPQPGVEVVPPSLEALIFSHWTTREVPFLILDQDLQAQNGLAISVHIHWQVQLEFTVCFFLTFHWLTFHKIQFSNGGICGASCHSQLDENCLIILWDMRPPVGQYLRLHSPMQGAWVDPLSGNYIPHATIMLQLKILHAAMKIKIYVLQTKTQCNQII